MMLLAQITDTEAELPGPVCSGFLLPFRFEKLEGRVEAASS